MLLKIPKPDDLQEGDVILYLKEKEGSEQCYVIEVSVFRDVELAQEYCNYVSGGVKNNFGWLNLETIH